MVIVVSSIRFIYIWNEGKNEWGLTYSKGISCIKTLEFIISNDNETIIHTGIRFDKNGEYQTSTETVNL